MLSLTDKDCKAAILSMFKVLKETMVKEFEEDMKMTQQVRLGVKTIHLFLKAQNRNSRCEKYSNKIKILFYEINSRFEISEEPVNLKMNQ